MYTLREHVADDPRPMFDRLAAAGYVGVESAGLAGLTPAAYAQALADAGLRLASAHVGFDPRDDAWPTAFAAALDEHAAAGADTVVVPMFFPNELKDLDRIARSAARLDTACELATERGLRLGYHNHFWEMVEVDGKPALTHLFERCRPEVFAEIDIYWAQVGGADPAAYVASLGDRVRLLHVKDGPADSPESAMVAVGSGTVAVAEVIAAAPSADWHIVELDRCDTDIVAAVEASAAHLIGTGLSTGARA
jgi:sugar phosphate isomerase/epimerase